MALTRLLAEGLEESSLFPRRGPRGRRLPDVIQVWYESRRRPFDARGDEDQASHFLGSSLRPMNSYGNLLGSSRDGSSV
jgi:hypothetical protein